MRTDRLEPYRRHQKSCRHKNDGQNYTKCRCPVWVDGYLQGDRYRQSLKTRDWSLAVRRIEKLLEEPTATEGHNAPERKSLSEMIEAFLSDCEARNLAEGTLRNYKGTLDDLVAFCQGRGAPVHDKRFIETLTKFRASRKGRDGESPMKSTTHLKELATLRSFCAWCVDREWIPRNWAKALRPPKDSGIKTLPYSDEEIKALLAAVDRLDNNFAESAARAKMRARAFLLLLLYTGLRISDAMKLERAALDRKTGKLLLRIMKTGVPLYVSLKTQVIGALDALPFENPQYFFWTGKNLKAACYSMWRTIQKLGQIAGVHAHPHRFRDTFAKHILTNGADLRTLQHLLGHQSVKTTEKHYAHFYSEHQKLLDAAVASLDYGDSIPAPAPAKLGVSRRDNTRRNAKRNVIPFLATG